ncbi:MAG: NACHT domain-containing protein [Leptolyngbyaceae cyanobacterium]
MIANEFGICGFPEHIVFTEALLSAGRLLILLDGLDEVLRDRFNQVITEIEDFADRYDGNRFLVSCREAAYKSKLKSFSDVRISTLSDKQVENFIENWFSSDLDQDMKVSQKFIRVLNSPENEPITQLSRTPLLLTFLCLVYGKKQNLPNNRSEIFEKALSIAVSKSNWKKIERMILVQFKNATNFDDNQNSKSFN